MMQRARATTLLLLLLSVAFSDSKQETLRGHRNHVRRTTTTTSSSATTRRFLSKGMMMSKKKKSFDEFANSRMEDSADGMGMMPEESSGDAMYVPGDSEKPVEDSADGMIPPPTGEGMPGVVSVNVRIAYFGPSSTTLMTAVPSVSETAEEQTPTEDEIDLLISNTVQFFSQVYVDAFDDKLVEIKATNIITESDTDGLFLMTFQAELTFSDAPTTDEVESVTEGVDQEEYIVNYVRPSGPYFEQTDSVTIESNAEEVAMPTMAPTTGEPTSSPTMAPTMVEIVETDSPTMAPTMTEVIDTAPPTVGDEGQLPETAEPTSMEVIETESPTMDPTMMEVIDTAPPTVGDAGLLPETAEPTSMEIAAASAEPTVSENETAEETLAPTQCPGTMAQVVGTMLLELDPDQDLTNPTEDQIVEVAQHILQGFGVILRDDYGDAIRGFSATIDETNQELDGNAYPLAFDATILFFPCAPPEEVVNGLWADADYPAILEGFDPTGEDNVFQHLTGEADFIGETTISA